MKRDDDLINADEALMLVQEVKDLAKEKLKVELSKINEKIKEAASVGLFEISVAPERKEFIDEIISRLEKNGFKASRTLITNRNTYKVQAIKISWS